jgi:hypothetical protein
MQQSNGMHKSLELLIAASAMRADSEELAACALWQRWAMLNFESPLILPVCHLTGNVAALQPLAFC